MTYNVRTKNNLRKRVVLNAFFHIIRDEMGDLNELIEITENT